MADFTRELAAEIPRLRRYARGLTHDPHWADDLVQDTMERALSRRLLFRGGNLRAWLFTVLYRIYLDDLARERRAAATGELAEAIVHPEPGTALDMEKAMARLAPEQRAVMLLVGLEQMSYRETASILGIPLGTVMSRLSRSREQLRAWLAGETPAEEPGPTRLTRIK